MTATPHDRLFELAFSDFGYAAELFRSVLPPVVVQHIDFRTRAESTTFTDDKLRARYSDLLFRVQLAGSPRLSLYL